MHRLLLILSVSLLTPTAASAAGTYGLEFWTGLLGEAEKDADGASAERDSLSLTWGITPWFELPLGKAVAIGSELNFFWYRRNDDDDSAQYRRLVIAPHARIRMSFPVVKEFDFDAFLSTGPAWWTATDGSESDPTEDHRFGWGVRFGFGGSFRLNREVTAFVHLGYQSSTSYGDAITYDVDSVPLAIGLRGQF